MADDSSGVGGGGLWLGAAKLWFLIAAYAITVALTHLVSAAEYGMYVVVARIITVPNMVLIYTVLFTISRPLAAQFDRGCPSYGALRARGLWLAAGLGGTISVALLLAAPGLASWQNKPELTAPLRVVAPISLIYALYAVNVGTLNAVRRFRRQATLDVFMATSKAGLTIGAAGLGLGLTAVVGGFTLASALTLGLSTALVIAVRPRPTTGADEGAAPAMAAFAGVLVVFTAIVNLLQATDLLILSSFAVDATQERAVGFYSSAMQVALIPFSLLNAIALLVFPLVASIDQAREPGRVRDYLAKTTAIAMSLLVFMSAVASSAATDVQSLLFPKAYGAAASELRLLVWGFSGYSLAVTVAWIFNSAKRSKVAVALVSVPLLAVIVGAYTLVPSMFTTGAATAVAIAGVLAVLAALLALHRSFGATVELGHMLKLAGAAIAVEAVARAWPLAPVPGALGKLGILLKLVVLAATFITVALATRAVTLAQLRELRRAR